MEEVENNSSPVDAGEKSEKPKFRFSPDATPFVPKNFRGAKVTASDTKASALSVEAREFYPRNYVCRPESRMMNAVSEVRQAIVTLTSKPADFEEVMFKLVSVLSDSLHDKSIIEAIMEDLFVQSVAEKNFRYTGARMCGYLSSRLQPNYGLCFQDCLVSRCRNEFGFLQTAMSVSNLPVIVGFTLYLGELLVNMKDVRLGQAYVSELAQLVAHLINILLNFRSDESVRTIVQTLKLSGPVLEEAVPTMNALCAQIHNITCDPLTPRHLSVMLSNVLALRPTNWGRNVADTPVVAASHPAGVSNDTYLFDDDVLCDEFDFLNNLTDSDEQLSPEGAHTEYWAGDDIMDSETAAAFELFMAESQQASSSSSRTVLPNCHSELTSGHP